MVISQLITRLLPTTAKGATRGFVTCFGLIAAILYLPESGESKGNFVESLASGSLKVLVPVFCCYGIAAAVLIFREKRQGVRAADDVEYLPESDDYRSVNYSNLKVSRTSMPSITLFVIGITLLSLGAMMSAISLSVSMQELHGETGAFVLSILNGAILAVGLVLTVFGWSIHSRASRDRGDFDQFLVDNNLQLTRDEIYLAERANFYQSLIDALRPAHLKVGQVKHEITGSYRGRQFHSALIKTRRLNLAMESRASYVGITIYPYSGDYIQTVKLNSVMQKYVGLGEQIEAVNNYVVFITLGLPRDRETMMKQFQHFDKIISVARPLSTVNLQPNYNQEN